MNLINWTICTSPAINSFIGYYKPVLGGYLILLITDGFLKKRSESENHRCWFRFFEKKLESEFQLSQKPHYRTSKEPPVVL